MKKTAVISICGVFAALSVVIMLPAYFSILMYALPAIAGALLMIILIECGVKNAFLVYIVVSVCAFFINEKETALCYVLIFGLYPIVKSFIERIKLKKIQWLLKLLFFNVFYAIEIVLADVILGVPISEMMENGLWFLILLLLCYETMFIVYDIALTRLITLYLIKYQVKFRRIFKLNKK